VIPQAFIQELLARVDVVDVVGRAVQLRKAGANYLGLCPFHGEKTPSFTVSPTKQFYHCFGCGAHGSAIGFLMEHSGLSYVEAIRDLAASVGLQVPDEPGPGGEAQRRDPGLAEVMAAAARFYKQRLKDSPRAIGYLKGRGLGGETAARFAIGYAPDGWRNLQAGVPDYASPALVEAGLVIESQGDDGTRKRYDRFRDRIMFPIRNPRGQVIGFGGRVLDSGEPKYMNSPETPLFSKGRELYGLFEARDALRDRNCAIVVEGYMDVVMLAQHGVPNAVATLGTATTPDHVRKLLRLVDRVVFSFDGDAAGRKAAWRALEACLPQASDTKRTEFLFLPPEHDPDSYVREFGADGFETLLGDALPLSEFMIHELSERAQPDGPEGRARFLALSRPLLQSLPMGALRLQLVHRIADLGAVSVRELETYLAALPTPAAGGRREAGGAGAGSGGGQGAGGRGDRGPRGGYSGGGRPGELRPKSAPPAIARRARLLSALHPALAFDEIDTEFLPEGLVDWLALLRHQPAGSSLAVICESLRGEHPQLVASLERDAAADRALVAEMSLEEARAEFHGAIAQLRSRRLREELGALAAGGLADPAALERYQKLLSIRHKAC
jgi:DNA primase